MQKELLIITGAGQGIGAYLSENLFDKYFIVLISKSNNCKNIALKINKKKSNSVSFIKLDFEKKINFEIIKKKINLNSFSNVHLIFCAGYLENYSKFININEWKKVFNVNVFSHLEIFNYFIKKLIKIKKQSKVIFLSGGGAANSFATFPAYSASKTSIVRIVENLSLRFENNNLSIFALAPGAIQTKMLQKVLKKTSVRTKTSKKEILKFISYCLEFDSSRLNGRLIHIRDDKLKIEHNKNNDYLKLRRIE